MDSRFQMQYLPVFRKMSISCETFGGFSLDVDIALLNSKQEIINYVLDELKNTLEMSSMTSLIEKLSQTKKLYHIHDYDIGYMLMNEKEYYICNHNCNNS